MNTWPGGMRRALSQAEHVRWNVNNDPGTRQLCAMCDSPTEHCEEDSLEIEESGPLCGTCYKDHPLYKEI